MNIPLQTVSNYMEALGLSFMAAGLESFLADSERNDQTLLESISGLLELEYIPRKERSAKSRVKLAGFPSLKLLEDFDLSWLKGGLTKAKLQELSSLAFMERKDNIVFLGPSGLGKTHLVIALAHKACVSGYTAYFTTCMDLMEQCLRAKEQNRLKRKLMWLKKPHVLVIDEVGYETLTQEQANLFFQVVNARYESGPLIITTNKPFGKWAEMMSDEAIATATLDRLLHHSHIISLNGDSFRMKDRLKTGFVEPV